jgi:hypothetical protein
MRTSMQHFRRLGPVRTLQLLLSVAFVAHCAPREAPRTAVSRPSELETKVASFSDSPRTIRNCADIGARCAVAPSATADVCAAAQGCVQAREQDVRKDRLECAVIKSEAAPAESGMVSTAIIRVSLSEADYGDTNHGHYLVGEWPGGFCLLDLVKSWNNEADWHPQDRFDSRWIPLPGGSFEYQVRSCDEYLDDDLEADLDDDPDADRDEDLNDDPEADPGKTRLSYCRMHLYSARLGRIVAVGSYPVDPPEAPPN